MSSHESWKLIPKQKYYSASSLGRIKRNAETPRCRADRILLQFPDKDGYPSVKLSVDGTAKTWTVHILIAATFIGPKPLNKQVNHKDGKIVNNRIKNLEYLTQKEHGRHTAKMGFRRGITGAFGEQQGHARLTEKEVLDIRLANSLGESLSALARRYKLGNSTVYHILKRHNWKHI
jgi:hypothetical protein